MCESQPNDDFDLHLTLDQSEEPFGENLMRTCANLYAKNELLDVTLSCSDGRLQAHKVILAASSTYLYNLLTSNTWPTPCSHPVILLRGSSQADVRSVLEFLYHGKLSTRKNKLPALIEISRELGLTALRSAIEKSIQSYGVQIFRRLSSGTGTSGETSKNSLHSHASSPSIEEEHSEDQAEIDEFDEKTPILYSYSLAPGQNQNHQNQNGHQKPRAIKRSFSEATSIQEKVPKVVQNGKKSQSNGNLTEKSLLKVDHNVTSYLLKNYKSNNSNNSSSPNSNEGVDIKSENFVYTSEDLGMVEANEGDEYEEDNNEQTAEMILSSLQNDTRMENDFVDGVPASCPWCMQVFTNLVLLQRHIKTHVGNYRPFTCDTCHSTFARSAHLKRHERIHTGEKPYVCNLCNRAFARQDKLKVHLVRHLQTEQTSRTIIKSNSFNNGSMTITASPTPIQSQNQSQIHQNVNSNGGKSLPVSILIPASNSNSTNTTTASNSIGTISTVTSAMIIKSEPSTNNNNNAGVYNLNRNGLTISKSNGNGPPGGTVAISNGFTNIINSANTKKYPNNITISTSSGK